MDEHDCVQQVEIARLQEQVKASATALALAEKLTAAATVAARANVNSNWSAVLAIISILISLWFAFHGKGQ
jgi:hypothetical protein